MSDKPVNLFFGVIVFFAISAISLANMSKKKIFYLASRKSAHKMKFLIKTFFGIFMSNKCGARTSRAQG